MTAPPVAALLDLTGRVALVTGASGNIGAGIARRLHEAGASVVLHSSRDTTRLEPLVAELGTRVAVVAGDVERDAAALCAATVDAFEGLHVVVNNAGVQPVAPLLELTSRDVLEVLRVNVGGVVALTRAAALVMSGSEGQEGGCVVNVASIEGLQPAAAALELGPLGIRVNAVAPGLIDVDSLEVRWPEGVRRWREAAPLTRLGTPQDVADAVLFLASPAARWITGATLVVDGGVLTHNTW